MSKWSHRLMDLVSAVRTAPALPSLNAYDGKVPEHGTGRVRVPTTFGDEFVFFMHFDPHSRVYECLIEQQPSYGSQPDDAHNTHRLPADGGGLRICFMHDKAPTTLPRAIALAQAWAELTSRYIRYGGAWN